MPLGHMLNIKFLPLMISINWKKLILNFLNNKLTQFPILNFY